MEASPTTTFRACSSPAPTPVKPQPAPAILSQELVHTMLSITHHTRKRPSTSPQTTQALNLPLDVCIDNTHTHIWVTKENRKKEKKRLIETPTSDRKPKERQRARLLEEEQVSDPLGKGNDSTHLRQKPCSSKEHKPPIQSSNNTKSSPCTHASSP
jgi:hypothetical protein